MIDIMKSLINPRNVIQVEIYKRFAKKYKAYSVKYRPGDKIERKYFFGLICDSSKIATDFIYEDIWPRDLYTREELINSIGEGEFDKRFEIDSDGTIYYKPHIEIVIKDAFSNGFKYFNSDQDLQDWIDTELGKEDLKLKTRWINL